MQNKTPIGRRYSHVYLPKREPQSDSVRMRRRLATLMVAHFPELSVIEVLQAELGTDQLFDLREFLGAAELRDVLDSITIVCQEFDDAGRGHFLPEVRRIFEEESVSYRLDTEGGVHPLIDQAFEISRVAAIAALGRPHHGAALAFYEQATDAWEETPPNWRDGVRHLFDAAETLFKLAFSSQPRLTPGAAQTELKALIDAKYQRDPVSQRVAHKMLASFNDWIEAAQFYRHAPGQEQPSQPPDELAIQMLGTGTAFVRWLAEFLPHGAR